MRRKKINLKRICAICKRVEIAKSDKKPYKSPICTPCNTKSTAL